MAWLTAATVVAYANALGSPFQFDDYLSIVDNPAIHAWPDGRLWLGIRPLLKLSYILNWQIDSGTAGFHAVNLALHVTNVWLVHALASRLAGNLVKCSPSHIATLAALLFALHPVQTEAVTYISGRSMPLMTMFYLGSLLAYLNERPWRRRLLSPVLFACALASKETAVTLPFALVLWERVIANPRPPWPELARRLAPHFLVLALAVAALAANASYRQMLTPAAPLDALRTQIAAVAYLISRLIRFDALNIDPGLAVEAAWTPTLLAKALAFVGAGVALWLGRQRRAPVFGALWLLLQLAPTNSLVIRWDVASERHLYLASVGLFIAAGVELDRLLTRLPGAARRAGIVGLALALAAGTLIRNNDYRSQIALWTAATRLAPGNPRAFNNLGYAHHLAGECKQARANFDRALQLSPGYLVARNNLLSLAPDSPDCESPQPR